MAKLLGLVAVMVVPLAIGACTQTAGTPPPGPPPGMTVAQANAYCYKLSQTYIEYVGSVGGALGGNAPGGAPADIDARVAIAQCQDGSTGAAIPVLQRKLRDNKVDVPPPPAA